MWLTKHDKQRKKLKTIDDYLLDTGIGVLYAAVAQKCCKLEENTIGEKFSSAERHFISARLISMDRLQVALCLIVITGGQYIVYSGYVRSCSLV